METHTKKRSGLLHMINTATRVRVPWRHLDVNLYHTVHLQMQSLVNAYYTLQS